MNDLLPTMLAYARAVCEAQTERGLPVTVTRISELVDKDMAHKFEAFIHANKDELDGPASRRNTDIPP